MRKRQFRHRLVVGNWNITSLRRKEHGLVEEVKRYFLDAAGIYSTKHRGSNNVEHDDGWKLSYADVDPAKLHQLGLGIPASLQLARY